MRHLKTVFVRTDCDTLQAHLATLPAMCAHVRPLFLMHTLLTTAIIHTIRAQCASLAISLPFPSFLDLASSAVSARVHPATDLGHLSTAVAARPHRPSPPPPNTPAAAQHCLM